MCGSAYGYGWTRVLWKSFNVMDNCSTNIYFAIICTIASGCVVWHVVILVFAITFSTFLSSCVWQYIFSINHCMIDIPLGWGLMLWCFSIQRKNIRWFINDREICCMFLFLIYCSYLCVAAHVWGFCFCRQKLSYHNLPQFGKKEQA